VSEQKYLMENKLTKQTNSYQYLHNLFSAKPNEGFARKTQHLRSPCYKMVTRRGGGVVFEISFDRNICDVIKESLPQFFSAKIWHDVSVQSRQANQY